MRTLSLLTLTILACSPGDRASEPTAWESWRAVGVTGGTLSAPGTTIGTVLETAITSRGQILVLDGAEKHLLAFDEKGRVLARGPGSGDLPGVLVDPVAIAMIARDPVALAVIAGDSVVLVDRNLRRIEVLAPIEDGLRPVRSATLDFRPEGACVLGGELFLLGNKRDVYLHRFAISLEVFSSFSPVPSDPGLENEDAVAGYRRVALGGGRLACDDESGLLVHAPSAHRQVYGIRPDGRFEWTLSLDSLALQVITPGSDGLRFDLDPAFGYAESVLRVTPLGDGQAQLLIRRSFAQDASRPPEYRAILIDVTNGEVLRHVSTPRHFGVATRRWATEHLEEPVTAVRIWRR
jgi:hypothetical protein